MRHTPFPTPRAWSSRPTLIAVLLAFTLVSGFAADLSEPPRSLAEGIAPTLLEAKGSPLLFWQEARIQDARGQVWIVRSRQAEGIWTTARVAGPLDFRGSEPILYSAAVASTGIVALAVASSGTSTAIYLSSDGGASFEPAGTVSTEAPAVGPRIFPSATGGWMLFLTQARAAAPGQDPATFAAENTNSLYVAASADGRSWSSPKPLVADDEGLINNYLPSAAAFGDRDVVVFQNQVLAEGNLASHYMLYSKVSLDGGVSWSRATLLTSYQEPAAGALAGTAVGANAGPENYDNQAGKLLASGGRLQLAWQRRFSKGTQVRIASASLDAEGRLDPKSPFYLSSPSGSYILAEFIEDLGAPTVVFLEDRLAANEVLRRRLVGGNWQSPETLGLTALADPARAGATTFARAAVLGGRLYALWQYDDQIGPRLAPVDRQRIFLLEPVLHVDPPRIAIANYRAGERSRDDLIDVGISMPRSSAGIARLVYTWTKSGDVALAVAPGPLPTKDELWKSGTTVQGSPASLRLAVPSDGNWVLDLSLEDRAGNRSTPVSLTYFRDRTPPPPPLFLPPAVDDKGALASNSFELQWLPSEAEDLRGYTWARVGPLDPNKVPASLRGRAVATVPGITAIEAAIVQYYGLPKPPPDVLGTDTKLSQSNIDNGYWLYSVAAVDRTGNVSDVSTLLLRTDKQVPFTLVYDVKQTTDLIGRRSIVIDGRGFLDEGVMARVILSRSRNQPWDLVKEAATGGFRVASNGLIDSISIEDIAAGSYWIGLYHPKRGLYWAPSRVVFDLSGTLKYGVEYGYRPEWSLAAAAKTRFSIYDVILAAAVLFFGLGILLSIGQAAAVWRDGVAIKLQVLALVNGGTMPSARKEKELKKRKRQGIGLQFKFTLSIGVLVFFVTLLVAVILGLSMVQNQSQALARGLGDAAKVLLESAAQSGRFFLDKEGAVTQLGFLPAQAKALPGADYITITGNSADPKVAGRDVVYATNDPDIRNKIDSSRLELGVTKMKTGVEALAEKVPGMALELEAKAKDAIAGDLARKADFARQKDALPKGTAGDAERQRINQALDGLDLSIRDRLRTISDEAVGSIPNFDPTVLTQTTKTYLFFKPILEYRPADQILYRGMVRLSANTSLIVADVNERARVLIVNTAVIAAVVLLFGVLAAFFLSRSIVRPIRRVINAIERMRRTEDKADLEGFNVEVGTRDELFVLAGAANALAAELVDAAKQSKALIEGSDIQNQFIPLSTDRDSRIKLTISRQDDPLFELFGYYKGAKQVSGDYWNFQSLGDDHKHYYFIKCDVSGKDVSAAFIMVQVATLVINHFNQWKRISRLPGFELDKLTYQINDFLVEMKYRGRFAAFTIGVMSMADGNVTICHAGDNMYRAWRASTGRTFAEPYQAKDGSPATGLIDTELLELKGSGFYTYKKKIEKGDILLLYSDGIEDAIHRFRDADFKVVHCDEIAGSAEWHAGHGAADPDPRPHSLGEDNEHIGPRRIDDFIEAYDQRRVYHLRHNHETERDIPMSFDFTKATGNLDERVIAYIAVGRVFCLYDFKASDEEYILVDKRVDAFLQRYLDQYELIFRKRELVMVKSGRKAQDGSEELIEDPNYVRFRGIREEEQYDDLSIVGIRRK